MNIHRSGIYMGQVRHRRFHIKFHEFTYQMHMVGLNLDTIDEMASTHFFFGTRWYHPIRFHQQDYLKHRFGSLKERVCQEVKHLGGDWSGEYEVFAFVQSRFLGFYFSPANFYFCYNAERQAKYMLVEVSNTPWSERHYYLINLLQVQTTSKEFHVSPFMKMNMTYHWKIKLPNNKLFIHMDSYQQDKAFDASLTLTRREFKIREALALILKPPMVFKVVLGIYWQALKIYLKGIPFIPHPKK